MLSLRVRYMHLLAVLLPLLFGACSISQAPPALELSPEIRQVVPDRFIKTLEYLNMPLNLGENPPSLDGTYQVNPFSLHSSSVRGDIIGQIYSTYLVTFCEVSDDHPRLKVNYSNGPESGACFESAITGNGRHFTVFARLRGYYNGYQADLLHLVSGTLTEGGIQNLYFSSIIIDNYGNPGHNWLDNGHGRVFHDSDGFSPAVTIPGTIGNGGGQSTESMNRFSVSSAELVPIIR
ncbi:MAG: hypothetical protein R6V75_00960 [Bacteroidales bacterium]